MPLRELCCLLFTTYTADLKYRTESGHLQKFSDDTAIVRRVEGGREVEFRDLFGNFLKWCGEKHLQLNVAKTKEMVVDSGGTSPALQSALVVQTLWIHSNIWVWCWIVNWSGLQTWSQSTRRA